MSESTYPFTQFQVTAEGILVQTQLAPGLVLSSGIAEQTVNELFRQWIQTRQDIEHFLATVRPQKAP